MWKKTKPAPQVQISTNVTFAASGVSLFPSARLYSKTKTNKVPQGLSCSGAPDIFVSSFSLNSFYYLQKINWLYKSNLILILQNTPEIQSDPDFESAVLNNLRRAEERKKLIEQMQADDET